MCHGYSVDYLPSIQMAIVDFHCVSNLKRRFLCDVSQATEVVGRHFTVNFLQDR